MQANSALPFCKFERSEPASAAGRAGEVNQFLRKLMEVCLETLLLRQRVLLVTLRCLETLRVASEVLQRQRPSRSMLRKVFFFKKIF